MFKSLASTSFATQAWWARFYRVWAPVKWGTCQPRIRSGNHPVASLRAFQP